MNKELARRGFSEGRLLFGLSITRVSRRALYHTAQQTGDGKITACRPPNVPHRKDLCRTLQAQYHRPPATATAAR